MKSHDLGQFLFNSGMLDEPQLSRLIGASRKSEPTLAVEALFLQLISAEELSEMIRANRSPAIDDRVRTLITDRQANRAEQLRDGQSIRLAQSMLNNGVANFLKLERILNAYHDRQVPPLESMLTIYYENWKNLLTIDFPFAIELMRGLHAFLSEMFNASLIILPPSAVDHKYKLGASVKLAGGLPVVTGIFADENAFVKLAACYDDATESIEDAFDVIAELLNIFIGHFAIKTAMLHGIETEPEPPRRGELSTEVLGEVSGFRLMTDVGTFYVYINGREIF